MHSLYFAICHGREAGKAAVHNLAGVAQSQGYRVTLAHSKLVPLKQAEDVLTMDQSERALGAGAARCASGTHGHRGSA